MAPAALAASVAPTAGISVESNPPPPSPSSVVPPAFPASIPHLFAGQPLATQMGPGGRVGRFSGCKGTELASYWWPASAMATTGAKCSTPTKAVILLIHGHGSYCLHEILTIPGPGQAPLYKGSWAEAWNGAGYAVAGLDARGAGFSQGTRCFAEAFADYTADVASFAAFIHAHGGPGFAGLPIFLVGVSLGGCIAVHAAEGGWVPPPPPVPLDPALARPPPPHPAPYLRGVVLLAPMLALDAISKRGWNRVLVHVGRAISILAPKLKVARTPKNTLHPHLQALWDGDPLCWHEPTRARNGMEYLRAVRELAERTPGMAFPLLAFHGEVDTLTDPGGTAAFVAAAGSADKTFVSLPDRWHILVREPGNEAVQARIIQWCDARL